MSHTSSNKEFSKESFRKQTTLLEKRMDESIPWDQKCKSSKELFKIKKSVDTIFDGVERCKQTIAKRTYFGNIDPFIQNTIEGNFGPQISKLNADLEQFHLCLKEEMVADLRYFNSLEHEVDTLKSQLETQKTQFLNEIDRLSREYYYADHMNAILGVYTDLDEVTNLQCDYLETWEKCEHLEKELSNSKTMSKSFEALQKHAINLELDLQHCKEKIKNDKSFKENQSNVFLKEREQYVEIQDLKAQLQDKGIAINELKKLIEKMKGKSVETKFEKSSVIRQPNAFKSQRQSILGKPAIFSDSLAKKDFSKSKSFTTQKVSHDFSKPVTAQILPQNVLPTFKNTNVIAPGMYKVHTKPTQTRTPRLPQDIRKTDKHVSFSTGVIPNTSVSRPQLKSNHLEDRVMSNNSQGKKQEVEDHRRKFKFSNNKTSVTASSKKTVATDSTVKKFRNTTRKIYEQVTRRDNSIHRRLWVLKAHDRNLKLLTTYFCGEIFWHGEVWNDQIAPILGYGDLVQGAITIKRVYYVEGLNHNLFSVGQFCDAEIEKSLGKKYVLVIVDDFSRYTWTHFLRSKDETPGVLIDFLTLVQRGLHAQVTTVRTDKGTEFLNKSLHAYFAKEGIRHETSTARTPEQNGVVERRNRTLVEAARTMLSAAKVPLFFWAEAIATACFTQNRSLVIPRHEKKTLSYQQCPETVSPSSFTSLVSLCYIIIDGENLDKIGKENKMIVETIHVNFDELPQMASDHVSSDPGPQCSTTVLEQDSLSPGPQSQENVHQVAETVTTSNELELLYSPMFSELLNGSSHVVSKSSAVHAADNPDKRQQHNTTHTSTTTDVADPPPLNIHSTHQTPTQVPTVTAPENIIQAETNTENATIDEENISHLSNTGTRSSETPSRHVNTSTCKLSTTPSLPAQRWTKDHPLEPSH
ncbi:retrovirus-related pol polyprotein from transposon TNT 1-94 [Tanacetum coccineum]